MDRKTKLITALYAFVRQRSGMNQRDYGNAQSYRAEQRSITRDGNQAQELIRYVAWHDSITADDIITASKHAFSGRLTIIERDDGAIGVDYCTGQYFATEYRRAVCAVMANCLWSYFRTNLEAGGSNVTGDNIRASARRELGASLSRRWFK